MTKTEVIEFVLTHHKCREKQFSKLFNEFYLEIQKIKFPEEFIFRQKLYHWIHDDIDLKLGLCPACGNRCSFESLNTGYKHHCSKRCSTIDNDVKQKRQNTCLEKYGVTHESKNEKIKEKKKQTCQKHYGVDWPMQAKENLEKTNKTNLKKYGVKYAMQSEQVKQCFKNTIMNKYGVEHPSQAKNVKNKKKETYMKRFGVECPFQYDAVKEKSKQTCLEKYGVENAMKSEKIKEKVKNTNLERYGVIRASITNKTKEKTKNTNLEKYGVEHPSQSESIKEKSKQTCLKKYGVENAMKSEKIKEKTKNTNIEKYGTPCPLQNEKIKEKTKNTNLEKYGVEHPSQSEYVKEKIKNTNFKKYGVDWITQSIVMKEKSKQTCLEKYGVENAMKSENIKEKVKNTNLERYGVACTLQAEDVKAKIKNTNIEKYGSYNPLKNKEIKNKIVHTNLEKYGVPYTCMRHEARNHSNESKPNKLFAKLLDKNKIIYEREFSLEKYSYDFKIGNNILVEINPTITHNSFLNIFNNKPIKLDYHLNKSKCAEKHNYKCMHVWDWDDLDKIVNMLKSKKTLYARNLELKEVPEKECNEFLNKFHLQNTCKNQIIRIGLYKDDALVQIMTFGKPRYNKNYELELLRLCSHKDYKIVGGAEKIFKYILDKYKPESIISYCDNSKFSGDVYERLGFKLKNISSPSRHWYNIKTRQHITDNLLRQRGFDQLFGTDYGKGASNEELMLEHDFLPICDCGITTYIFESI